MVRCSGCGNHIAPNLARCPVCGAVAGTGSAGPGPPRDAGAAGEQSVFHTVWNALTPRQRRRVTIVGLAAVLLGSFLLGGISLRDGRPASTDPQRPSRELGAAARERQPEPRGEFRVQPARLPAGLLRAERPPAADAVPPATAPAASPPAETTVSRRPSQPVPPSSYTRPRPQPRQPTPGEQFLQALALEAARQQRQQQEQQYQRFREAGERLRMCQACRGEGSYRFVDAHGNLRLNQCPHCYGMGRRW